jgi:hypothetical protein
MQSKYFFLLLMFIFLTAFSQVVFSQVNCDGGKIFTEKRCAGDEISSPEKELYQIVNEYRVQNDLSQVPLSETLSVVANRHLLDLVINVKSFTHGWSNCAYDMKDQKTWDCVFESPKRLNSGYSGKGYENLYRNKTGNASAILAIDAWKKSDIHNSLILNLKTFKDMKFDALGIAINGQYAALWFGVGGGNAAGTIKKSSLNEFGITFEKATADLSNIILFDKSSTAFGKENWSAASNDKSIMLRLGGKKEEILEAVLSIKPGKINQLDQKHKDVLNIFLNNVSPEWSGRKNWLNASLIKIQSNPKMSQTITLGNKIFVMNVNSQNSLSLSVTVSKKPTARQL